MKDRLIKHRKRKGVVLIISVGILALVAMIATSFALNMQVEYRAAVNYLNSARATALAQAGIDKVIADIRYWVANSSYSTVISNINSYSTAETALGNGYYEITIGDTPYTREEQKININALDQTDSPWIDLLLGAGLTTTDVGRLIDYRDPDTTETTQLLTATGVVNITGLGSNEVNSKNALYATVDELRLVLNNDTKYDAIKNMITVYAPIIKGGLIGKYYSNRDAFNKDTILGLTNYRGKVIELGQIRQALEQNIGGTWYPSGTMPGADGSNDGWAEAHDAEFAGGYIAEDWNPVPGFGLDQFGVIWTGFIYIPDSKVGQPITFKVRSEDGFRVIIDNVTVVEDWNDRSEVGGWTNPPSGTVSFAYAGWHPLRIDFYSAVGSNMFELKWDALGGASDYIPAEYLGYQPASYYGNQYNDFTKTFYAPTSSTGTLYTGYNSAGIFKITSKGRVKRGDGTILAEKQITTVLKLFDTRMQTTRAEFYAPWFSLYDDFSDGEIRNVNWLDSCPTDNDYLEATSPKRMHWEKTYTKVADSLKLGYWNDFDDDVAYSVATLKGGKMTTITGITGWTTISIKGKDYVVPATFSYTDGTWTTSYGEISYQGANTSYCLNIWNPAYREKYAEVNGNFYAPGLPNGSLGNLGYDIFVRTWTRDNGQQQTGSATWWRSASTRLTNPEESTPAYTPSWCEAHLEIKRPTWPSGSGATYLTLLDDGDTDIWGSDLNEIYLPFPTSRNFVNTTYSMDGSTSVTCPYILGAIGRGTNHVSYWTYQTADGGDATFNNQSRTSPSSTETGIVQLNGNNMYELSSPAQNSAVFEKIIARNAPWYGCNSEGCSVFDDIRVIYPKGYLVSSPFVSKYSTDNSNIKWGTVSWTADTPTNTSITMYIRSADTLATTDNFTTSVTNGASLSAFTERQIQYKALLSMTLVSNANLSTYYQNSSATPVLKDVTITYMLPLETLYRK